MANFITFGSVIYSSGSSIRTVRAVHAVRLGIAVAAWHQNTGIILLGGHIQCWVGSKEVGRPKMHLVNFNRPAKVLA